MSNCSSLTHQMPIPVAFGEDDVEETVLCQRLKSTDSKGAHQMHVALGAGCTCRAPNIVRISRDLGAA